MIVIDASVMIAWLLDEPTLAPSSEFDILFERQKLIVPPHWVAEVGNALLVNARRGRISPDQVEMLIEECGSFDIVVETTPGLAGMMPLIGLARSHSLNFYDAAYVQIARDRSIPLATLDNAMRSAARNLGVRLIPD